MKHSDQEGFTALELIVTMTVIAVLLSTGVPAVKNYAWNLRMKTAMDSLQTDLNLTRGNAISHNIQTVICPSINSIDCSGQSAWHGGWIVFSDLNDDHQRQDTEPLLKQTGGIAMQNINSSRSRNFIRFFPNGSAPGSNISILFCDKRGAAKAGIITVSNSGRIRMQTDDIDPSENCP